MKLFMPDIAYLDPRILKYEHGKSIKENLEKFNIPIVNSKNVSFQCDSPVQSYVKSKKTVLVTVNSQKKLPICKPSADYQFALSSSCPGNCEYCYLQTTQGEKPFMKIFANIDDIFKVIQEHIDKNSPNITTFECASITDPVALEHFSGSLKKCIEFFSVNTHGRLRLVTKFNNVDSFLDICHNKHTRFRFSINSRYVINSFEHNTSSFEDRIEAAKKIGAAGYPLGFIVAPIMVYDNWKQEYRELFERLREALEGYNEEITFELIQHRFTNTAKELILQRFPNTKLDLGEEKRQLKWGPYGKFKFVYAKEQSKEIKEYISELINNNFEKAVIEYFT